MEILGQKISTKKRNYLEMDVASLYTRTGIKVPVIIEKARAAGPTLLLLGGIHGDEINGIEIVRRLLFEKRLKPHFGTVICLPVVNVMAFLNMNRSFADGRDLNRSFPGSPRGSLAGQVANSITKDILPHADYVVDLHCGAADRFNHPQIRYDLVNEKSLELANAFDAPFTLLQNKAPKGSFRSVLNDKKIPVIVFEGGKSKSIDQKVVESGMRGVLNVLDHLEICKYTDKPKALAKTIFLTESRWIRAKSSGMFQPMAENGSLVKKGQILGYINGPYAQFQRKVTSPIEGYIFCASHAPVVHLGDAIFHIGKTG